MKRLNNPRRAEAPNSTDTAHACSLPRLGCFETGGRWSRPPPAPSQRRLPYPKLRGDELYARNDGIKRPIHARPDARVRGVTGKYPRWCASTLALRTHIDQNRELDPPPVKAGSESLKGYMYQYMAIYTHMDRIAREPGARPPTPSKKDRSPLKGRSTSKSPQSVRMRDES